MGRKSKRAFTQNGFCMVAVNEQILVKPILKKGYKETEVGVIPEDWKVKTLIGFCELKSGSSITSENISDFDKYPCFGGNGLRGYTDSYTHSGKYGLIGRQGALCGNVNYVDDVFFASEHAIVVTSNNDTDIKWLTYVLSRMNLNQYSESSAQPGLSVNKISILPISTPPTIAEQTAIATALSDADALINSVEKLIAKKRNIKQGAMQKLLQPKEGWEVKKLGEVGDCIIGLTYTPDDVKESGILVLRSSNIQGSSLRYDDNVYVDCQIPEKLINMEDDILICVRNGSRNLIGKCTLIKGRAIGETFGAFMSIFRSPFNKFIFLLFQSDIIKKQIDEHLGATINQITNKSLNSFEIPFPTFPEQTRIATILSDMDAEITALENKLEKYQEIKLGMMQNLLTGKIRLV